MEKGELDALLVDERDRELFYACLSDYRVFSDGYGCPLSDEGGHAGRAEHSLLRLDAASRCSG